MPRKKDIPGNRRPPSKRLLVDVRGDRSSPPSRAMPPGANEAEFVEYIETNWDTLAEFGYESYLDSGRGIVFVFWDGARQSDQIFAAMNLDAGYRMSKSDLAVIYMSEGAIEQSPPDTRAYLKKMCREYNPQSMIVIGFYSEKRNAFSAQTLSIPDRLPCDIWIEGAGRLSEFVVQNEARNQRRPDSKSLRALRVELDQRGPILSHLFEIFRKGWSDSGSGGVLAMPDGEYCRATYASTADLHDCLPVDPTDAAFKELLGLLDQCNPQQDLFVIGLDKETLIYYPYLLKV